MADRRFNARQALDYEIKELYVDGAFTASNGVVPSGITSGLIAEITYTSATKGTTRNADTITSQILVAAANPTDTILAVVSGTIDAVVITITPNDGTNNSATPVDLTTAELAELVSNGTVVAKTVTLTDTGSLLDDLSATGGDTTVVVDSGEGDGVAATLANGAIGNPSLNSSLGIASITRTAAGSWKITLSDKYVSLRSFSGILLSTTVQDIKFQIDANSMSSKELEFFTVTTTTATDPVDESKFFLKIELKNSSIGE